MIVEASPSAWTKRLLVAALAAIGAAVSAYLALFQLGVIDHVWDPLFGASSSRAVLHSSFSESLPVPDALLGAANYVFEVVLDLIGDEDRWRDRPLIVLVFGLAVAAGAVVSIFLICMQAFVIGHFCMLCLISAGLSLVIAPLAYPEVAAAWERWRS